MFGEDFRSSLRVSLALVPTLIFTLVLAGILRDRFAISEVLFGALLLYAAFTTLLPSLIFRLLPMPVEPSRLGDQLPRAIVSSSGMAS
ncbi:MAG TPA: cation:proton antiporter, partial [Xylella sp.]